MAIVGSHLTTNNVASGDPHTTASITPTGNSLVLAFIRIGATGITVSSVTGNSLTWVQVTTLDDGNNAIFVFRALGASPTTGAVTIDLSAAAICAWSIVEFSGVTTSGTNGSGAVVQSATNVNVSTTSLTVTLGAFSDAGNATTGGFYYASATLRTMTEGTGFTVLGNVSTDTIGGIISEWKATNDTSVDASISGTATFMMGVALEITDVSPPVAGGHNLSALLGVG